MYSIGYFLNLKWLIAFEFFLVIIMTLICYGNVLHTIITLLKHPYHGNQSADSSPCVSTSWKFSMPSRIRMI